MVSILLLLVGVVLGAIILVGLNVFGINVSNMILPRKQEEKKKVVETMPEVSNLQEEEMQKLIAELKDARAKLNEGSLGQEWRRLQQERETLRALELKINAAEEALKKKMALAEILLNEKAGGKDPVLDEEQIAKLRLQEANTKRLAKMWSGVDPAEVPPLAQGLDTDFTARVLYAMSERKAGPILSALATAGEQGSARVAEIMRKIRDLKEQAKKDEEGQAR